MKLLFAYDLDGTLLRKDNSLHPNTKDALRKVQQAGHYNVIATGRGLLKVLPLLDKKIIEHVDFLVCSNGAVVYDVKNQTTKVLNTVPNSVFYILKDLALKNDLILTVDTPDYNGSYLPNNEFPKWMSQTQIMDMNILNIATLEKLEQVVLNKDNTITQIALRNPLDHAKAITDEVREATENLACEVYLTNSIYTDVNPVNISKFSGVKEVLDELKLTPQSLVAFGDSGNDIEMITTANVGIAVGNATEEAKKSADRVIGDHETDAIGQELLTFI
ncbi:HAD family hydrolase [Mycoplasma nasistruthionis]|uniref:HAD family hydrolase n=1 Tax=Mycoplasma nasistruthionis TaxID=353852 RepID=A0A5B7XWG6_9MOLU|nr:HAD family hydrolase [Mycoplasma nasistruthionis]QCZ36864.1 HAD family hydrolase [Mycoplasma nasistruthionis]